MAFIGVTNANEIDEMLVLLIKLTQLLTVKLMLANGQQIRTGHMIF